MGFRAKDFKNVSEYDLLVLFLNLKAFSALVYETDLLNAFSDCLVFIPSPALYIFLNRIKITALECVYTVKKRFAVFPSSDGMSLTKLPLGK